MLRELGEGWRRMRTIASAEWVAAAAHAAVRLGEDAAELLGEALADAPHHTVWSRAAIASLNGTLAAARGDYGTAALAHLDAAERYASAGSATDRFLALGGAIRALSAADTPTTDTPTTDSPTTDSATLHSAIPDSRGARIREPRVAAAHAELTAFAGRNQIVTAL
jgi:hypothetical protein